MIEIIGLSKTFRTVEIETIALNNVSLKVSNGDFLAIMGPSGCGKSTLLNLLGLLDNPSDGSIMFDGFEVMSLLKSLNHDGATIIMVTHSPDDAEYANRIIHLFDGQIVTENIRKAV